MIPYLDCLHPDNSHITLEIYPDASSIRFLEGNNTVALHQHRFYEMILILRGSCQHFYRSSSIPLIPGDLFLVPPNQPHSYRFQENISLCNCQFYREALGPTPEQFVSDIEYVSLQQKNASRKRLRDMQAFRDAGGYISLWHAGDINGQGVIHLDRVARDFIASQMQNMLKEQNEQKFGFERVKQMLLEHVLIQIKRVQMSQFESRDRDATWKDDMVDAVLNMMEKDITRNYDFHAIARAQNISITYFRSIFKSITGLSPVEYLNRVRILRALELLQTTALSVSEAGERVGFYDTNYFSRLFKKVIGYPPSYFKAIPMLE